MAATSVVCCVRVIASDVLRFTRGAGGHIVLTSPPSIT